MTRWRGEVVAGRSAGGCGRVDWFIKAASGGLACGRHPPDLTEVLRSASGVGTLHDATGGRPGISRKYHEEMAPFGVDQELLVALRTRGGEAWGAVGLYREMGAPLFDPAEIELMRAMAPELAAGARYALLAGQAREPDLPDAPGLVVLDERLSVTSATPTAVSWLAALSGSADAPPASVLAVAGRAPRGDHGVGGAGPCRSRSTRSSST
jgi:hypothetical protein